MRYGLTPKEMNCFLFIKNYITRKGGISPSYDDIKIGIEIRSKSGVARLVRSLREKGWVADLPNKCRSVVPLENTCKSCGCDLERDA
jgi:repressor LexA